MYKDICAHPSQLLGCMQADAIRSACDKYFLAIHLRCLHQSSPTSYRIVLSHVAMCDIVSVRSLEVKSCTGYVVRCRSRTILVACANGALKIVSVMITDHVQQHEYCNVIGEADQLIKEASNVIGSQADGHPSQSGLCLRSVRCIGLVFSNLDEYNK